MKGELRKRPEENRNITIVCLGKEIAVDSWVEDYNIKHPVNKFEIIELRTDKKHGKFLIHSPDFAEVEINRSGKKATVEIKNFISPTIVERLNSSESLMKIQISDCRSMIDVVLIDDNYSADIFNVKHADIPGKNELVQGKYELDISEEKTSVAVKIIDMLGEEVLVVKEI